MKDKDLLDFLGLNDRTITLGLDDEYLQITLEKKIDASLPQKPILTSPDKTAAATLSAPGTNISSRSKPSSSKYPNECAIYCGA